MSSSKKKNLEVITMQAILLRIKSKNKRKKFQWINDIKKVHMFLKILLLNNFVTLIQVLLQVGQFRKNLGITNNQSAQRERHNSHNNKNIRKIKYGKAI